MAPVFADDDPLETLGFIEKFEEPLISTSRIPRPTSRIAENITVITADDIARINAHTLADVLQTIPGIQLEHFMTPTTWSFFSVQGALDTTVLVLIDGIRQNDFQQNMASPHLIPVQQIERIEVIKGATSASWGSALGGVINIITKSPNPDRTVAGMVSGSIGSRFTTDSRAELNGTKDRFGYYLTASNIHSDGLSPNTGTNLNNLYGKLAYTLPGNGTATFGISHLTARPGLDEADTVKYGFVHDNNENRRTYGFLKFNQPLGSRLALDIDGYLAERDDHTKFGGHDDQGAIVFFNNFTARESSRGANARLTWGDSQQYLVTGFEYGHARASNWDLFSTDPPAYDRNWDRWAVYGNGAYSIGQLTILPGIRFDKTGISDDTTSYTLGATYQLSEATTLRAYGADGFSLPTLNNQSGLQKIKTFQGGMETGALPYLWLKGTYFRNTLRNSESAGFVPTINNQNREGFEIEARTTPILGFSLTGGYTYLYAKNSDTGERLQTDSSQSVPPHTVKLALNYNKTDFGLRGALTGNYVWWNSPADGIARSAGMIWDLHLNWKINPKSETSPELFFSGHNLLNGVQTTDFTLFDTPSRWFDGGIRVRF
ncbi:MAG TPA: TonB-dependent receptor [Dongiaceae bacterium]|nr:TonB-dependent receptor [Dongiaceae bacterium]